MFARLPLLRSKTKLESLVSREATFLYNNLLFVALTLTILWGVVWPILSEAVRGESVVVALDQRGVSLSSGSACKSGSPEPTHVLVAMGRTAEEAHCAVRFSLSRHTTEADIDDTATALGEVLEEMESTVRFLPCK